MSKKGFTLIELLITIAIIGIIVGIAIPGYIGTMKKAARSEAYSNLETLRLLEEQLFADSAAYNSADRATTALIQANEFPAFRPGTGGNYNYSLLSNQRILSFAGYTAANSPTWQAATPCFSAVATGIAATRGDGDIFTIDCNNVRNF